MPKIKVPKSAPSLDMTPMVDLAFLLVTFFMLTASFRMAEPVVVDPPSSTSDKLLPENVILVTVDNKGRAFFTVGNAEARINTLKSVAANHNVTVTPDQEKKFSGMSSFGVDIKKLPAYIDANDAQRLKFPDQNGVPMDSTDNQLKEWIIKSALELNKIYKREKDKAEEKGVEFKGEKPRYAIKADSKVKYIYVKDVFKTFTDMKIYTFNLITSFEGGESAPAPKKEK